MADPATRNPDGTWKDGVSGNPAGRPKRKVNLTAELDEYLDELGLEARREVYRNMVALALSAEGHAVSALKLMFDRVDGLPERVLNLQGETTTHIKRYGFVADLEKKDDPGEEDSESE